jgi:antitoxin VapB
MNEHVATKKVVHVFKNGRSRAVRIPKEFDFEGDEVEIQKQSDGTLMLRPVEKKKTWSEVFASMEPLGPEDEFPEIADVPAEPVDLGWDDEN